MLTNIIICTSGIFANKNIETTSNYKINFLATATLLVYAIIIIIICHQLNLSLI